MAADDSRGVNGVKTREKRASVATFELGSALSSQRLPQQSLSPSVKECFLSAHRERILPSLEGKAYFRATLYLLSHVQGKLFTQAGTHQYHLCSLILDSQNSLLFCLLTYNLESILFQTKEEPSSLFKKINLLSPPSLHGTKEKGTKVCKTQLRV